MPAHVVCGDEDVGLYVDQPGGDVEAASADRAPGFVFRDRRCDRGDLAAADRDIEAALEPGGGIEHLAVPDQQVVFHGKALPVAPGSSCDRYERPSNGIRLRREEKAADVRRASAQGR